MLPITSALSIDEREITFDFIRSTGPGGQNVNKVATAVQLRFDVRRSACLPLEVKARLEQLAGRRLTREGILVIEARRFRTQEQNRLDAMDRLAELIRKALEKPRPRRATKPSRAAKAKRVDVKKRRGALKSLRQSKLKNTD